MSLQNRFQDQNFRLTDFQKEVCVVCPKCDKKALAKVDYDIQIARLYCVSCGYNKETSTSIISGRNYYWQLGAHSYFKAELWLKYPFKNDFFWAFNDNHLSYLEQYITATLREHKDRSHFTLLEKLPIFYHEAKNREALLKIINKLRKK